MIAFICLLFSFVCLAHSRSYYYGLSNHGSKGKPSEKLYIFFIYILDFKPGGGWDLDAFDFKMPMELRNPKQNKNKLTKLTKNHKKRT